MRLAAAREERALCCAQGSSAEVMPRLHGYRDVEEQQIGERAVPGKLGTLRCCRGDRASGMPGFGSVPEVGSHPAFPPVEPGAEVALSLSHHLGTLGDKKFNRTWCRWGRNDGPKC